MSCSAPGASGVGRPPSMLPTPVGANGCEACCDRASGPATSLPGPSRTVTQLPQNCHQAPLCAPSASAIVSIYLPHLRCRASTKDRLCIAWNRIKKRSTACGWTARGGLRCEPCQMPPCPRDEESRGGWHLAEVHLRVLSVAVAGCVYARAGNRALGVCWYSAATATRRSSNPRDLVYCAVGNR